jgi:hypothetical protein
MTVPDRTGDSVDETIRYSWSGTAGDPLVYQFNGGTSLSLASNVQQFNVSALARSIAATSCILPGTVTFQGTHSEAKASSAVTSLIVPTPTGLVPGNLMVAVVSVGANAAATLAAPSGWTLVNRAADSTNVITTGVCWKFATPGEPADYSFTWTNSGKAYGWIARFSGVEPSAPINASAIQAGLATSFTPPCPNVTTTVANTMIVRIGGFSATSFTIADNPAIMTPYTTITADKADSGTSTGSAGVYATKASTGATTSSSFVLTGLTRYVTFTLALTPDDGI